MEIKPLAPVTSIWVDTQLTYWPKQLKYIMTTYNGFSTYNRVRKFTLADFDLIKQDLFNHFSIRKGEKLMNPNFGTIIWDLMFEPLSTDIRSLITNDIKTIIDYDPRVAATQVLITEYDHGIQIELELNYVLTNQVSTMALNFDRNARSLTLIG
jgi:phage baseplate assembly protein W